MIILEKILFYLLDKALSFVLGLIVRAYNLSNEKQETEERAKKAQEKYDTSKDQDGRRKAFKDAFNAGCSSGDC